MLRFVVLPAVRITRTVLLTMIIAALSMKKRVKCWDLIDFFELYVFLRSAG
jgi:hypothetical protein